MVGQRLQVMRSDEPLLVLFARLHGHRIIDHLQIVVGWQIDLVTS